MDLIIFQTNLNLKGGAENVILRIADKYNPTLYTFNYNKEKTWAGFKEHDIKIIKPYAMNKFFTVKSAYGFHNFKLKENYDVINPHWSPSHWISQNNERVLWYCHSPHRAFYDLYSLRMKERSNLLTKAGFIDQVASGIFDLLPLGKRALTKIETIIREELTRAGHEAAARERENFMSGLLTEEERQLPIRVLR